MIDSVIASINDNNNDTSIISQVTNGGIGVTLLLNTLISTLLLLTFSICVQRIPLYSVERKANLLQKVHPDLHNKKLIHKQEDEDEDVDSLFNDGLIHDCAMQVKFVWYCIKTLFIPKYKRLDREHTTKKYGRDVTTYLFFQQQMFYAIVVCAFIGLIVLLPVHMTGRIPDITENNNTTDTSMSSALVLITSINMRINDPSIQTIHVILSVVFYLIVCYFMVFRYLLDPLICELNYLSCDEVKCIQTDVSLRFLAKQQETNVARPARLHSNKIGRSLFCGDHDVSEIAGNVYLSSPFCVSISGLPSSINLHALTRIIEDDMKAVADVNLREQLLKIVLINNLKHRVKLQEKIYNLSDRYEQYLRQKRYLRHRETDKLLQKTNKLSEAIEKYSSKIDKLERDISRWDPIISVNNIVIEQEPEAVVRESNEFDYFESKPDKMLKRPKSSRFAILIFQTIDAAKQFISLHAARGLKISEIKFGVPLQMIKYEIRDYKKFIVENKYEGNRVSFYNCKVERVRFEPEDVNWMYVFSQGRQKWKRIVRRALVYVIMALIFLLFSSPLAMTSGIQSVLNMDVTPIAWLRENHGIRTDIIFQYLPTLLVLLLTNIMPTIVVYLTLLAPHWTNSVVQRELVFRAYCYLTASTLILPR
jgi:hypothetical protein